MAESFQLIEREAWDALVRELHAMHLKLDQVFAGWLPATENSEVEHYWTKKVLTVKEVALYTGLSAGHIRNLASKGKIPYSKPMGKILYFEREKLEKWLLGNPVTNDCRDRAAGL
ncbi:helix-turn-helix domain-containing protein [Dyadobacter sp. OTU695]|uniref:helix-turn-helix domain-containing protein n=1 Tax=Dyadobacter sp. OTU695 TaxID=3043860 RepID=UPI00313D4878